MSKLLIKVNVVKTVIGVKTKIFGVFLLLGGNLPFLTCGHLLKPVSLDSFDPILLINIVDRYAFILKRKEKVDEFGYLVLVVVFLLKGPLQLFSKVANLNQQV